MSDMNTNAPLGGIMSGLSALRTMVGDASPMDKLSAFLGGSIAVGSDAADICNGSKALKGNLSFFSHVMNAHSTGKDGVAFIESFNKLNELKNKPDTAPEMLDRARSDVTEKGFRLGLDILKWIPQTSLPTTMVELRAGAQTHINKMAEVNPEMVEMYESIYHDDPMGIIAFRN